MDKLVFRENVYKNYSIKIVDKKTKDPISLVGHNWTFKMFDLQNVKLIDSPATITDDVNWEFTYNFDAGLTELSDKGKYKGYFLFDIGWVYKLSFPEKWFIDIEITDDFIA